MFVYSCVCIKQDGVRRTKPVSQAVSFILTLLGYTASLSQPLHPTTITRCKCVFIFFFYEAKKITNIFLRIFKNLGKIK